MKNVTSSIIKVSVIASLSFFTISVKASPRGVAEFIRLAKVADAQAVESYNSGHRNEWEQAKDSLESVITLFDYSRSELLKAVYDDKDVGQAGVLALEAIYDCTRAHYFDFLKGQLGGAAPTIESCFPNR